MYNSVNLRIFEEFKCVFVDFAVIHAMIPRIQKISA